VNIEKPLDQIREKLVPSRGQYFLEIIESLAKDELGINPGLSTGHNLHLRHAMQIQSGEYWPVLGQPDVALSALDAPPEHSAQPRKPAPGISCLVKYVLSIQNMKLRVSREFKFETRLCGVRNQT